MTKKLRFERLIKLASQPVQQAQGEPKRAVKSTEKQTRQRKIASISAKPRGKSRL